ncbi:MAG: hypothetical protein ABI772_05000 [Bacteroidota bacterium]
MTLVYRFRVTFEDYDEVTRDIEIKSSQTFEDLHHTIQACIGFDGSKPASFYISNDNWIKGQEIALEKKKDKDGNILSTMKESKLASHIADPHQKIYYISDYEANWGFMIELIKILSTAEISKLYPVCNKSVGEPPKQYNIVAKPVVVDEEFDGIPAIEDAIEEEDLIEDETEDVVEMDEIEGMSEEGEEETATDDDEMEVNGDEAEGESESKEGEY